MRIGFLLILLAAASSVYAADISVGHRVVPDDDTAVEKPMAWRYSLLQTAQDLFEQRAAKQAPGAKLTFRLPKVDAAQADNQVEIVQANKRLPVPMVSNTTFALVRDTEAAKNDAMVVVNRNFRKGEMNHPNVRVRSPDLPDGVNRMGDLRLACAAQIAMGKAENLKFRALLATVGVFVNVCDKLKVNELDGPDGHYDTVTIEDDGRRLIQPAGQKNMPRLGDKEWSDNARISYTLNDRIVQ